MKNKRYTPLDPLFLEGKPYHVTLVVKMWVMISFLEGSLKVAAKGSLI